MIKTIIRNVFRMDGCPDKDFGRRISRTMLIKDGMTRAEATRQSRDSRQRPEEVRQRKAAARRGVTLATAARRRMIERRGS